MSREKYDIGLIHLELGDSSSVSRHVGVVEEFCVSRGYGDHGKAAAERGPGCPAVYGLSDGACSGVTARPGAGRVNGRNFASHRIDSDG